MTEELEELKKIRKKLDTNNEKQDVIIDLLEKIKKFIKSADGNLEDICRTLSGTKVK